MEHTPRNTANQMGMPWRIIITGLLCFVRSTTSIGSLQDSCTLGAWVKHHGGFLQPDVEVAMLTHGQGTIRGVRVQLSARALPAGTFLLGLPQSLTVTEQSVHDSVIGPLVRAYEQQMELRSRAASVRAGFALSMWLWHVAAATHHNMHTPYLCSLPTSSPVNLSSAMSHAWQEICTECKHLLPALFHPTNHTCERLDWAVGMVASRSFSDQQGLPMLAPVADLFNGAAARSSRNVDCQQIPTGGFECRAVREIMPGEELILHYGDYCPQEYQEYYGFVPLDAISRPHCEPNLDDTGMKFACGITLLSVFIAGLWYSCFERLPAFHSDAS